MLRGLVYGPRGRCDGVQCGALGLCADAGVVPQNPATHVPAWLTIGTKYGSTRGGRRIERAQIYCVLWNHVLYVIRDLGSEPILAIDGGTHDDGPF